MAKTKEVSKELSMDIPLDLIPILEKAYPHRYLSGSIRAAMIDAELHPERDLSSLSFSLKDCKKKNLYMTMEQAKSYEKEATKEANL